MPRLNIRPAPWTYQKAGHGPIDVFDASGHDIFTLYGEGQTETARLIAASPDILKAAIEVVAASDAYEGEQSDDERCHRALDALRAAIAKATGEAVE
jgi:hypothetical protein